MAKTKKKNGKKKKVTGKIVKKKKKKQFKNKTKPRSPKSGAPENKMIENFDDPVVDTFLEEHEEETKDLFS